MAIPTGNDRYVAVSIKILDIGTAQTAYVVAPVSGTIRQIFGVIDVAVTAADNAVTTGIQGTAITGGGMTFPSSGSAAGQVKVAQPTAANVVTRGQAISVTTDGGGAQASGGATFTFLIEQN